ncbi:predicted protein [Naegleria gruberi]|uniref:Predicted protein n=1 Tax=Naegleria gruberi TaxID=5762 RepID=D2V9H8_NAEGR|nr:uncharacterized protein NAEGRDRAFT_57523 [Naegleria gruberi]EFC46594.1 predicted protein [Naegleria gruberi]|eukprot:XP_002679338.1 predicted protein [Naegleria gruberi strain NEG-M]
MSQAVSFTLIDFSSNPSLKQHFSKQQDKRLKQLEYLQDLQESGEFISDFIKEYPIPHQPDDSDRKFIFELVRSFPYCIKKLSDEYYEDVEFVKYCLEMGVWDCQRTIEEIDEELIRKALWKNSDVYEALSENVASQFTAQELIQLPNIDEYFVSSNIQEKDLLSIDRNILIEAIKKGLITNYHVEPFSNDRELSLLLIKQHRKNALSLKSDFEWNRDEEAFDALVFSKNTSYYNVRRRQNVSVLRCTPNLVDDRDFVMRIIEHDPESFQYCSDRLRSDREIALKAISKDVYQMQYINSPLNNDREVIMTAISKHGQYFGKASNELKSDRELILFALKSPEPSSAAQYIDESFYEDPEIRDLIIRSGYIYPFINQLSDFTREQVIACVNANCFHLSKFPKYFTDEEILLGCVRNHGYALKEIPLEFRTFNVCSVAIEGYASILSDCDGCPFLDELVMDSIKKSTPYAYYLPKGYKFKSVEQFKEVIPYDTDGELFRFAPEEIKNDREIAMHYVKINGKVFKELGSELQDDPIMRKEAIKHGLNKRPFIPLK